MEMHPIQHDSNKTCWERTKISPYVYLPDRTLSVINFETSIQTMVTALFSHKRSLIVVEIGGKF